MDILRFEMCLSKKWQDKKYLLKCRHDCFGQYICTLNFQAFVFPLMTRHP